jgi:hypothetical protein
LLAMRTAVDQWMTLVASPHSFSVCIITKRPRF